MLRIQYPRQTGNTVLCTASVVYPVMALGWWGGQGAEAHCSAQHHEIVSHHTSPAREMTNFQITISTECFSLSHHHTVKWKNCKSNQFKSHRL